jgi:hypothetical protein
VDVAIVRACLAFINIVAMGSIASKLGAVAGKPIEALASE